MQKSRSRRACATLSPAMMDAKQVLWSVCHFFASLYHECLMNENRIYYFDFIRVYLAVIVFYHHSAISFGASGGWYYISESVSEIAKSLLSVNMGIDQSYFMSLFFFMSAYLLPGTFDKKGLKSFIKDRIKRLVVPLLLFCFVLHPLLNLWIRGKWGNPGLGPMWFVFTLLVFEAIYVSYRCMKLRHPHIRRTYRSWIAIPLFILITGVVAFTIRIWFPIGYDFFGLQFGYYTLYISMYMLGIIAYRKRLLDKLSMRKGYMWMAAVVFLLIPSLIYVGISTPDFQNLLCGGGNFFALYYAIWESMMCVGICYFLLVFGRSYLNRPNPGLKKLSDISFSFYIIHPFIVVGCVFAAEIIPVSPIMRLIIVCFAGIPFCFIAAAGFRYVLKRFGIKV